jgi:hypothetical protein
LRCQALRSNGIHLSAPGAILARSTAMAGK